MFVIKVFISSLIISLVILNGCSNKEELPEDNQEETEETNQAKDQDENGSAETNAKADDSTEQTTAPEGSSDDDKSDNEAQGLKLYRPDSGITKVFLQNDEYEMKYEIVEANNTHLQRLITFGDMTELQILKWTPEQISIVLREENPSDTSSQLNSFEAYEPPEVLLELSKTGDGSSEEVEIIKEGQKITVPAGTYENVYVVQKTSTSSTTGNEMIYTSYYAPNIGLIKDTREVTGENGYKTKTVLTGIKQ